jgi:hypothetical protein
MLVLAFLMPHEVKAAFVSGSTGADGAFEPTTNIAVQIPESGVFNYTTVSIPSGVTVTFKKNSQNTPVTLLATGDVLINGIINLNGTNGSYFNPGASGPGGFDGGVGGTVGQIGKRGEGPGGGGGGSPRAGDYYGAGGGGGAGFANGGSVGGTFTASSPGGSGGQAYNNERILPVIGGSGGGGGGGANANAGGGGGGGGGAIVIASTTTTSLNGSITANGGNGANGDGAAGYGGGGGGGAGGSVRLVASTLSGNGAITASYGNGGTGNNSNAGGAGSVGRIRLEGITIQRTTGTTPPTTLGQLYGVVPANMPNLTITSIGGMDVPNIPKGAFSTPDVMLPFNIKNPITVVVTGTNIPTAQTVTVKASPSVGSATSATGTLSGTDTSSSTSVSLNIATAYPSIITASVTFQLAALNGAGPIYAAGEKVEFVRVAANLGGRSSITYITESGKEVPATL